MGEKFAEIISSNPEVTIVDWLMFVITFIYVIATIFIFIANFKSAKASNEQSKMMMIIQRQNIDLELYDKRYNLAKDIDDTIIMYIKGIKNELKRLSTNLTLEITDDGISNLNLNVEKISNLIDEISVTEYHLITGSIAISIKYLNKFIDEINLFKESYSGTDNVESILYEVDKYLSCYSKGDIDLLTLENYLVINDFKKLNNYICEAILALEFVEKYHENSKLLPIIKDNYMSFKMNGKNLNN